MESDLKSELGFTQRHLPWLVAGVALVVYLLTLGSGISSIGLSSMVRATGWAWQPTYSNPLHYLLTFPVHWLPATWQIPALNSLSAICAALALALLARSVSLLPHNRTRDQRNLEHSEDGLLSIWAAWVPVVLAVLACGLQRSFWEHACIGTSEALDLLIFAYIIRCLLEFRIDQRDSWLNRMALVYGLGVTNNFALIAFFPTVLAALVWIKGRSFFNLRFCLRMVLLGLAGLSVYLLLPIIHLSYPHMDLSLWDMLRSNLGYQKHMLLRFPRFVLLFISFTSLIPVLFMGIKWPNSLGDISSVGNALTNLMTHVLHGLFLVGCLYVAFDPAFSPRKMGAQMGYVLLPFYYLGALSIGYFSGYFLLVFGNNPSKGWRRPSLPRLILNRAMVGLVWLALIALPIGLGIRNLSQIQATTGNIFTQYAQAVAEQLKTVAPEGAVVLSDDPYRLYATRNALLRQGAGDKYTLVDTTSLSSPVYHRHLHARYPQIWPPVPKSLTATNTVDPLQLVGLMNYLSQSNALYYLHPSFGYYFERFYMEPHKLLWRLKVYPSNSVDAANFSEAVLRENEQFWKEFQDGPLRSLPAKMALYKKQDDPNDTLSLMGMMYSRALNYLGVEAQKTGALDKANEFYTAALRFNPNSASAFINQEFNKALRAGEKSVPPLSEQAQKKLDLFQGNLELVLLYNGPIDEPNSCFKLAETFARGRNYRQAAQLLRRVLTFDAQNMPARLGLITMYNQIGQYELALQMISELRAQSRTNVLPNPVHMNLLQSEVNVYIGRGDAATAQKLLREGQKTYPTNAEPFAIEAEFHLKRGDITNALLVLETQMKQQPGQPATLVNYARLRMLNRQFDQALPYLDEALKLQPKDIYALLNRAIVNLKVGKWDAAESDYRTLDSFLPKTTFPIAFGLHESAWQKKDRKAAIKWAKEFLKLAPPGTPEIPMVKERLERLDNGGF